MENISPEACTLELDVCDGPDNYFLVTLDKNGELIEIIEDFTDGKIAHATAERIARETGLPYQVRDTPHWLA